MKYSEIVGVEEHFKSAFDITSDFGDSWKTFISNDKFENNMGQIIKSFTSPVFNNRKSIWVQGTYGTGKSHSLAVIEHLLCDEYENIEDYLPRINKAQIRNEIANFRKEKKVFPVVLKGIYAITDVADLTYIIQQQVAAALHDKNIDIATKTDFQSVIQILKRGDLDSFFENLISKNIELQGYAANKEQLILALENNETKVIRIIADELKDAGLGGFRTHNIIEWLTEVKKELENRKIADYLMLFWDEFTSLLDIPARRSILNVIQDIAEMSYSEISDGKDTLGVYIMLVTHKRLEQTESYKDLKEDERNMAKARFVELDYGMQPTTTYHILSGALEKRQPDILDDLRQKNFLDVASVLGIVDKVIDSDAPNAKEVKDKIISLYPFHPYTSYLATFVSRVVGEAERSIFGFLNDEDNGFKKYIEHDVEESKFLTADYVWDFFYKTFESNAAGHFDSITNKYKLSADVIENKGENYVAVFKTILLLNILYRVTTTDADVSEKSMVNPSTENIVGAFSGVLEVDEVNAILDAIDESQILHRNPDGIFEVASSSLPQKKIMEEKKKLYSSKEDVSKILEEYAIKCIGKLKNNISRSVAREVDVQVFWAGDKEHLLRNRVEAKFKNEYSLNVALFVSRGVTRELDEILGRAETTPQDAKTMLTKMSKEDAFKNIIFVQVDTVLGNKRFEAYLDSLAQEAVARSLQMDEERKDGQQNAEKWISQWVDEIVKSGMVEIIFRGDPIHVPFISINKYLTENYTGTIFRYGLDKLPVAATAWNHQTSKKAVELVLYASNKSTFEQEAKGQDGVVKALLSDENQLLFNEKMELVVDDEKIPVVKVCKTVQQAINAKKSEVSINLAEELEFLTKPEYGYYQNRLFMGALAFALRPFIDRLYTSGNGQRIDKTVMKEVIVAIFTYWENGKYNDKFVVRMSTEEEQELTEKLATVFGIEGKDGLLETKWAIREKFQKKSKAPLWVLKYVGDNTDKYCEFIDKLFKFSKSTDENIVQNFIIELLNGIKTYDVELSNAVASVENSACLDTYILRELTNIGENSSSIDEVKEYLKTRMSGEVVFWEEDDVQKQIWMWKMGKQVPASSSNGGTTEIESTTSSGDNSSSGSTENTGETYEKSGVTGDTTDAEVLSIAKKGIENNKNNCDKLYEILTKLIDKYEYLAKDINELL